MRHGNASWGSIFAAAIVGGGLGFLGLGLFGLIGFLIVGVVVGTFISYPAMHGVLDFTGYNFVVAFITCAILGQTMSPEPRPGTVTWRTWYALVVGGYFILSLVAPVIAFIALIRAGMLAEG